MNQPTNNDTILDVRNLHVCFNSKHGELPAVNGINYSIRPAETLGVVGESGCGKSVTAYAVMQLISEPGFIKDGNVTFNGQDLLQYSDREMRKIRGNKISMIFQEPMTALNPVLTIGKQMDEVLVNHKLYDKKGARERSIEMINMVGIPEATKRYSQYPHELSGGMRQRVMIAMALSPEPELLIADEPTTALDVTLQGQILDLLEELQDKFKMAVQFITHDLAVINEISDRVMVMYAGSICETANTRTLMTSSRHPYTRGLMHSIPKIDKHLDRLTPIEGSVPALHQLNKGCPFHNRCHRAKEECKDNKPELKEIADKHFLACFNPEDD